MRNVEEVFKVAAADVACLDDDDRRSAAAVSGETGLSGPMAEAAGAAQQQQQWGLASVGDRCELLSQQRQLTRGRQGQQAVSRGDSGRAARAAARVVRAEAATI